MPEVKIGAMCWNQSTDWPTLLQAGIRADERGYTRLWTVTSAEGGHVDADGA